MSDVFNPAKRSEVMSRIRSKGNVATEGRLVSLMKQAGITGWRRHQTLSWKSAPAQRSPEQGKVRPDFVFRRERVVVFVDGCFWHGCPKHATWPKQNEGFWREKILRNRSRDRQVTRKLRAAGWKVLRLWEHDLKKAHEKRVVARLRRALIQPDGAHSPCTPCQSSQNLELETGVDHSGLRAG